MLLRAVQTRNLFFIKISNLKVSKVQYGINGITEYSILIQMNPLSAVFLAMHFLGADPDTDAANGIDYPETMGGATEEQLKAMVHIYL